MKSLRNRCLACAAEHTPKGVYVAYWANDSLSGLAVFNGMWVPYPSTRRALFIFLHECGHITLGHFDNDDVPAHVEEYEANRYAEKAMQAAGLTIPPKFHAEMIEYVAWHLRADIENEVEFISKRVAKYAGVKTK